MRRAHPNCVTVLLTGYPAFESALQAIRDDVDDYFVKPAELDSLISTIERKLLARRYPTQSTFNIIKRIASKASETRPTNLQRPQLFSVKFGNLTADILLFQKQAPNRARTFR